MKKYKKRSFTCDGCEKDFPVERLHVFECYGEKFENCYQCLKDSVEFFKEVGGHKGKLKETKVYEQEDSEHVG